MPADPLVSVVIAAYNSERYLGEAIESTLAQDYPETEILVVDDGSTDGTAEVAGQYPEVKLFRQANQGPASARNTAIEAATGDLIAVLDSDDLMLPGRLRRQVDHLRGNPEAAVVVGMYTVRLTPGVKAPAWINSQSWTESDARQDVALLGRYVTATLMARRRTFEQVGLYDTSFRWGEDVDWIIRVIDAGMEVATMNEPLIVRRIHGENMILDDRGTRYGIFQAFKARIDRRRAAEGSSSDAQ